MTTLVTFYGTAIDDSGMPETYHVYSIWERPAPWHGPTCKIATIAQSTANAPLPEKVHYVVQDASAGMATQQAQQALENFPPLSGLMSI